MGLSILNTGHPGKIGMSGPPHQLMFLRQRERNQRDLGQREKVRQTAHQQPKGGKYLSEAFCIWLGGEESTSQGRINLKIYVFINYSFKSRFILKVFFTNITAF